MQPTAAFVLDLEAGIVGLNRAAVAFCQIPRESALKRNFWDLEIGKRVRRFAGRIDDVKRTHLSVRLPEVQLTRPPGEPITTAITLLPLLDDQRRVTGILVWVEDKTDTAHLRQQIAALIEERRIKEQELQRINAKLEDARDELVAATPRLSRPSPSPTVSS